MSSYAKRMANLSARIFVETTRPMTPKDHRVIKIFSEKPLDLRQDIVDFYPPYPQLHQLMKTVRSYGLYRDEHLDFKEEMDKQRKLRGKVRPPKGQGKKAVLGK